MLFIIVNSNIGTTSQTKNIEGESEMDGMRYCALVRSTTRYCTA